MPVKRKKAFETIKECSHETLRRTDAGKNMPTWMCIKCENTVAPGDNWERVSRNRMVRK